MGWEKVENGDGGRESSCKSCASCLRGGRGQDGWRACPVPASSQDPVDYVAVVEVHAFASGDFQSTRIQPQLVQDGRVDVRDISPLVGGVESASVPRPA